MEQTYIGIDVAKDSFVVATRVEGKVTTSLHNNDKNGINSFLKSLPSQSWCIMEATGVYSLQLAMALYEKGIKVSVVNPLQIKRFAQTKLWEDENRQGGCGADRRVRGAHAAEAVRAASSLHAKAAAAAHVNEAAGQEQALFPEPVACPVLTRRSG